MCLTTFSVIPCPFCVWKEEARAKMPLFLPLVGGVIGGLWALAAALLRLSPLPPLVCALLLCALPLLLTGGIHMDGFLDTVDAVGSRRPLEERRRILKDPHVGAFAVIAACFVSLAQFVFFASAKETANLLALLWIAVTSRTAAALAVTLLPPLPGSSYAKTRGGKAAHAVLLSVMLAAALTLGFVTTGRYGFAPLAVLCGYALWLARGVRALGGMSGDISGYALTFGELCGVAVYALI